MITLYEAAGLIGVAMSLTAYAAVQWQRDFAKTFAYSWLNLISSLLLLVSLAKDWNLAAVVSNVLWGLISAYGLYRCGKYWLKEKVVSRRLVRILPEKKGEGTP